MKKYFFMAVTAIAALSSCSNNDEFEQTQIGNQGLVFTATMEGGEGTRATYDATNKYALWEAGDKISINGKTYSAQEDAGATAIFKADGKDATDTPYNAYFPADLYDGTTATLPAIQTYTVGKFNMPMYAVSYTTELQFKNLCAVLAIKVTSADITKLKSIKVASDQKMNGSFTVTSTTDDGYKAVMGTDGTNAVVLESSEALTLTAEGTTFYIAIPAQTYNYLNIFLSADGETYTQAMATKKVNGLGEIGRSKIFNIDYKKNATKLWKGDVFVADCNVGASSATDVGNEMTFTEATTTDYWGANWCTPSQDQMDELLKAATPDGSKKVTCTYTEKNGVYGFEFTGSTAGYESNSVFFPAQTNRSDFGVAVYWSATADGSEAWFMDLICIGGVWSSYWLSREQNYDYLVRPVLKN